MQIVVDESLGLPIEIVKDAIIKKARLKNDGSLSMIVQKETGGLIAKRLTLEKKSKELEFEEMMQLLEQHEEILYVYDAHVINEGWLKRLRTWVYPNQKLFLLDGSDNRAFTIYFLEKLKEKSLEELYRSSPHQNKKFTLTNDSKYQSNYLLLKKLKQKQYYLFESKRQIKIVSGKKQDLLEQFLSIPTREIYIASRSPIEHSHNTVKFYELQKHSLPVCSDQTDIYIPQYENV
ncbi:hypothetical protein EKG37_01900 [Robertmurraya yapensis]|uniref:Uncharacterized protein n=2 Tax=Bacillaceae TaxID=186817 RepID=A0A431WM46_9BACI|nr:hypothetical protein [Bacillus yapensis]RTR36334.1 hypothetical protein EKG37_01900 [Bacillus yapensis]TKT05837.1 hypothetical protein FAR12_01900 [Bacillus yapensis]